MLSFFCKTWQLLLEMFFFWFDWTWERWQRKIGQKKFILRCVNTCSYSFHKRWFYSLYAGATFFIIPHLIIISAENRLSICLNYKIVHYKENGRTEKKKNRWGLSVWRGRQSHYELYVGSSANHKESHYLNEMMTKLVMSGQPTKITPRAYWQLTQELTKQPRISEGLQFMIQQ